MKWDFFQTVAVSILLCGCTWMLTKHVEKKLNRKYPNPVTPKKTVAVWLLTYHFKNYPSKTNKTCRELLDKQGRTHKPHSMDPYTWTHLCWVTRNNLHQFCVDTGCSLEERLGVMEERDGWRERFKESCQWNLMMMIIYQR